MLSLEVKELHLENKTESLMGGQGDEVSNMWLPGCHSTWKVKGRGRSSYAPAHPEKNPIYVHLKPVVGKSLMPFIFLASAVRKSSAYYSFLLWV